VCSRCLVLNAFPTADVGSAGSPFLFWNREFFLVVFRLAPRN